MRRAMIDTGATTLQVQLHPSKGQVPADSDRARPKSGPMLVHVGSAHDVLEREARSLSVGVQAHPDPAHPATEFPREIKGSRRIAARNATARIALELIAPSEPEVALDGQGPLTARGAKAGAALTCTPNQY